MSTRRPITITRPRTCPKCGEEMLFVAWSLELDRTKICHDCKHAEERRP